MRRATRLMVLLGLAYWATGIYFVQPDQQGIVRRFGAVQTVREPGAHWGLPWGFDQVDRLKPRAIRRVTVGASASDGSVGVVPAQFLTGDRNLINVRLTAQYTVREPAQYLFSTKEADGLVRSTVEAALSELLAGQPVDDALTHGKQALAVQLADKLQLLLDGYEIGVMVRSVDLSVVEPPAEVADAFDKVISALREREQTIHQAHSTANRLRAEAQGKAQQLHDQARSERDRLVHDAHGEAERFQSLRGEYERSPNLTASRLYLDAMAQLLPRIRSKLIVGTGSDIDLSIFREEKR